MRAVGLLLACAGCAAAPEPLPTPTFPHAVLRPPFSPSSPLRPRAAPPGEEAFPIDLETALRLAGAESLAIALGRERAAEAQERAREAEAAFLPSLRPQVSLFRHEGLAQETQGDFVDVDKQNAFAGAGAELTLDFGRALFGAMAARRRARAEGFGAEATTADALLEVGDRPLGLLAARDAVRIETDAVAQARGFLDVEESRRRLGAGLEVDVMRARANLAEAEGRLAEARAGMRAASAALVRVHHLDPTTTHVPAEEEIAPVERLPLEVSLGDLLGRAQANRPEVARSRARLEAAESEETGAAVGPLVPRLRLEASYGAFGATLGNVEDQEVYRAAL